MPFIYEYVIEKWKNIDLQQNYGPKQTTDEESIHIEISFFFYKKNPYIFRLAIFVEGQNLKI